MSMLSLIVSNDMIERDNELKSSIEVIKEELFENSNKSNKIMSLAEPDKIIQEMVNQA